MLLLAYRDGVSDERAMEAVRFDLRGKVALDLPVFATDCEPCPARALRTNRPA